MVALRAFIFFYIFIAKEELRLAPLPLLIGQ